MFYSFDTSAMRRQNSSERVGSYTFEAPVAGLVLNQNLARQQPNSCVTLENWFPEERSLRLRGGREKVATIGSDAVSRLMTYYGSSSSLDRLFAASETAIYNISSFDSSTAPTADITGLTSGAWSYVQQTTSGGAYLVAVNGADTARVYDGSSWSTSTISGVSTALFAHVFKFKGRLFFIESGSLQVHYLAADAISGNIGTDSGTGTLELGGVFQNGGALLTGGAWSVDAGDGPDDRAVFVSDKGEVAIYSGSDPSSASDWSLVGVYQITRPLGPNAIMRAGGDFMISTHDGLVAMSQVIQKDAAALSLAAVSRPITPLWEEEVQNSVPTLPWEILKLPRENMMLVSLPHTSANRCLVANLHTGAWTTYTNWDTRCVAEFQTFGYFGSADGSVFRIESGGQDDDTPYTGRACFAWSALRSDARHSQIKQMRATFQASSPMEPRISIAVDYNEEFPSPPSALADEATAALWDSGLWDLSQWDVASGAIGSSTQVSTRWRSAGASGFRIAPQVQVSSGSTRRPDVELLQFDVTYENGAIIV